MKQNENPGVKFYYPYAKPRGKKRKRVKGFENDMSYNETSMIKEQQIGIQAVNTFEQGLKTLLAL